MAVSLVEHAFGDPANLLTAIFNCSPLGFAIFDDRLRFQSANKALAEMSGIPVEAHLGKTLREVLGPVAAAYVEPKLVRAFATGEIINCCFVGALPTSAGIRHWTANYFPMENLRGAVSRVCAIVTELTARRQLELYLYGFSRKLLSVRAALNLRADKNRVPSGDTGLLDACISEMVAISKLPGSPLSEITTEILGQYDTTALPNSQDEKPLDMRGNILSRRERQVVQLLSRGKSNKEAADMLGISVRTVETHRANIMAKLEVHSVGELVLYAVRNNIVNIGVSQRAGLSDEADGNHRSQ